MLKLVRLAMPLSFSPDRT
jgi:jumonji domain-containing protein 7